MIRWLGHALIRRFERRHAYDAVYMHEILDASVPAFVRLLLAQALGAGAQGASAAARFAARFAAVRVEDCGPCAQLVIDMARAEGVPRAVVHAVVVGETGTLPDDVVLALRFAEAVLSRTMVPELEQALQAQFGARGRITLAYAIVAIRTYPALKRALGHAQSCGRLSIDGRPVVSRALAA